MHGDVHARGRRTVTSDEVLVLTVTLGAVGLFVGLVLWGIGEARRDERALLIADTRTPQVLDVGAGWYSANPEEEFAAYYPATVRAHPGDTIRFTNPTVEDPHSVTFGLHPDRSNQPRFAVGERLPIVNGACVSQSPLTPVEVVCDGQTASPVSAFSGQPYFNSGIIPPRGGVFELRLADTLAPGIYEYACVIHPAQVGTLEVVDAEQATQRPRDLEEAATELFDDDVDELRSIRRQMLLRGDGSEGTSVRAGEATARVSLNVFLPAQVTIEAGEAVTWTNTGVVPHVMIFGGHLAAPDASETPPTEPSGSPLSDGLFTTGPIGAPPYPRTSFTVRFDEAGTYSYVCTFHPGMAGTVTVLEPPQARGPVDAAGESPTSVPARSLIATGG